MFKIECTPRCYEADNKTELPWRDVDNFSLMGPHVESDVNQDGWVNILDALHMGNAFGSNSQSPNWTFYCDFSEDIEINILDAVIPPSHFGEKWVYDWNQISVVPAFLSRSYTLLTLSE